ncbi:MAG: response regulator [Prosthecobacter sp.]|nr:response regulator [Prosthecobacter sp.]
MSRTILSIEDNDQNRYLATFLLERNGHRVVSAPDGRQRFELARSLAPDLILLDIQLPTMDGYDVVRGIASPRTTPIIAVTSYAMTGDREKAPGAGCDGYIEKPIIPATFVAGIERFGPPIHSQASHDPRTDRR